ncbi:MAG: hypothetical protein KGL26_14905 [Pseudomonadota bacterium]|nr:hypothetical protein [Pseudomonadota bacterium]
MTVAGWNRIKLWTLRLALLLPVLAVALAAVPRLVSGLALEAAFPIPAYLKINVSLPTRSYVATAAVLSYAPAADGETQALRAEAALHAGEPPAQVVPIAEAALSRAPAFARGWIVLADLLRSRDPKRAAEALTLSAELAPHEYYLMAPRVLAAAPLWSYLPADTREPLLDDTRAMARDRESRRALLDLLAEKGGPALVTRAFATHPGELRALNRRLVRERLGLPGRD